MPRKIEISHKTVIFTVLFLISLWFLYLIREVVLQFFVALLIMTILNPLANRLSKSRLKIPRAVSTLIVYLLVLGVVGGILAAIIPALIDQTTTFAESLPEFIQGLNLPGYLSEPATNEITSQMAKLPGQTIKAVVSIFSNSLTVLAVFILAFYLILARERIDDQIGEFFGQNQREKIDKIINKLESKLGGWARAQLILMIAIGTIVYLGLLLLKLPFALPLAILAGLLEIAPVIGPTVAAIPAIIVGITISPLTGLATAALFVLVHQLENYVLIPNIMHKSVGLSPIITLLALFIGLKLAGVAGALLAVPIAITIQVLTTELVFKKSR